MYCIYIYINNICNIYIYIYIYLYKICIYIYNICNIYIYIYIYKTCIYIGNASAIIRDTVKHQYNPGKGFWNCIHADGTSKAVLAIADFAYLVLSYMCLLCALLSYMCLIYCCIYIYNICIILYYIFLYFLICVLFYNRVYHWVF
jgi:hypothetical protein